jgi:hypothetical protein
MLVFGANQSGSSLDFIFYLKTVGPTGQSLPWIPLARTAAAVCFHAVRCYPSLSAAKTSAWWTPLLPLHVCESTLECCLTIQVSSPLARNHLLPLSWLRCTRLPTVFAAAPCAYAHSSTSYASQSNTRHKPFTRPQFTPNARKNLFFPAHHCCHWAEL